MIDLMMLFYQYCGALHLLNQLAQTSLSILRCAAPVICCIIKPQSKPHRGEIFIELTDSKEFGGAAHQNIQLSQSWKIGEIIIVVNNLLNYKFNGVKRGCLKSPETASFIRTRGRVKSQIFDSPEDNFTYETASQLGAG